MSTIDSLYQTILSRRDNPTPGSYTSQLFAKGENEVLKKMGEEAVEVIIAAKGETEDRVLYELADFVYHTLCFPSRTRVDLGRCRTGIGQAIQIGAELATAATPKGYPSLMTDRFDLQPSFVPGIQAPDGTISDHALVSCPGRPFDRPQP